MGLLRNLLRLLCYERFTIDTCLSPEQALQALRWNVLPKRPGFWGTVPNKPFYGKYHADSFFVTPCISYRNPFVPVFDGQFYAIEGGSRICVTMRLHGLTQCLSGVFLAISLLFLPEAPRKALLFLTILLAMNNLAFWLEAGRSRKRFCSLFPLMIGHP